MATGLTPEEMARLQALSPGIDFGDAGGAFPGADISPALGGVATGQAPPIPSVPTVTAAISGPQQALLQLLQQEAQASPTMPGRTPGPGLLQMLGLGTLAASDVMAGMQPGATPGARNLALGLQALQGQQAAAQQAAKETRQAQLEQRKFLVETVAKIGQLDKDGLDAHQKALAFVAEAAKDPTTHSNPVVRQAVKERALGMLAKFGFDAPTNERLIEGALQRPAITARVARYAPLWDLTKPDEQQAYKLFESEAVAATFAGRSEAEVATLLESRVLGKVMPTALKEARQLAAELKQTPEFAAQPIPMQTLLATMRATHGAGAIAYEDFLTGRLGSKELRDGTRDYLADLGYRDIGLARKVGEKVAETQVEQAFAPPKVRPAVAAAFAEATGRNLEQLDRRNPEDMRALARAKVLADHDEDVKTAKGMREEFNGLSKDFREVRDAYGRLEAFGKSAVTSPAGQIGLIVSFAKIIDPTTGVREGERGTIVAAQSLPDRLQAWYQQIQSGKPLSPALVQDIIREAKGLFQAHVVSQQEIEDQYRQLAGAAKVAPNLVVIDHIGRYRGRVGASGPLPAPPPGSRPR